MNDSRTVALVAIGGAVGALARYGTGQLFATTAGTFPTTTFTINVLGAFALGVLLASLSRVPNRAAVFRPLLGIGVLGSFTTYSTFSVEAVQLWRRDQPGLAVAYVVTSIAAGLVAAAIGLRVAGADPGVPVPDGES